MGPDIADIAGILRDLVKFLESLDDAKLPETLAPIRESLLFRSKNTLTGLTSCTPMSPELYLDMNAGKGMLLVSDDVDKVEEYVDADAEQIPTNHVEYESFQEVRGAKVSLTTLPTQTKGEESEENDVTFGIYSSLSALQSKTNCLKCGYLCRKERRKLFVFELFRTCFVSLVGSHLLIYGNESENRPHSVITLRGYKSRPAPSVVPRDQRRSDSAFEIFRPGSKTFQFVAKSPEEMQDWVAIVCRMGETENKKSSSPRQLTFLAILEELEKRKCGQYGQANKDDRYQDILRNSRLKKPTVASSFSPLPVTTKREEKENLPETNQESLPPPLPIRAPRRLPSLPEENKTSSYSHEDEHYDEDDIYHRIEDLKEMRDKEYMNCDVFVTEESDVIEMYDDIQASAEKIEETTFEEPTETYDDVRSITRGDRIKNQTPDCDDILNISADSVPKTETQTESKSMKPVNKRSFLHRMRKRKDSQNKEGKQENHEIPTLTVNDEDLPSYDAITNIMIEKVKDIENLVEEEEEYLCPPPPRPVCSTSPSLIGTVEDDLYDDIGAKENKVKLESLKDFNACQSNEIADVSFVETEHYQIPRANNRQRVMEEDELYDDIAVVAVERQKEYAKPEKKIWSRGGSMRKNRRSNCEPAKLLADEPENCCESSSEKQGKIKTLQKFITKVENTLGKSGKTVSTTSSKSNGVTR